MDNDPTSPAGDAPKTEPLVTPDEIKEAVEQSTPASTPEEAATPAPDSETPAESPEPATTPVPEADIASAPDLVSRLESEPAAAPDQSVIQSAPKKGHAGAIIAIIIIILLVAGGVVACLMLMNNGGNGGQEEPEPTTEEPKENDISTVSCTAGKESVWQYLAEFDVDNTALKTVSLRMSLELLSDYGKEELSDIDTLMISIFALSIESYRDTEDDGLTFTSEGEAGAAGYSVATEIVRDDVKSKKLLKIFEEDDGKTAEQLLEEAVLDMSLSEEEESSSGGNGTSNFSCEIKK